ncbi:MAG: translocation/assembly module TamB domain-containing protein [Pyrinomonadaceae bacterium]
MSEENNNQTEEIQPEETETREEGVEETAPGKRRRRIFTRKNVGLALGGVAILLILVAGLVALLYRTGYVDTYIKSQFTAKMADFGMVFDATTFQVTLSPLELTLKNATFNDRITGDKLFTITDAKFGLTIKDLFAWQLSRDIQIDTTDLNGVEAWVNFDENGESNFRNINLAGPSVVNYSSVNFNMQNAVVHYGDVSRRISGNAENVRLHLEPEDYNVPDEEKRYLFNFDSSKSDFIYDQSKVEPIDIHAEGIADGNGAEIKNLKLTTPLGESVLSGTLTDWQALKYDLKIDSTVDLTQTSNIFPLGTPIRGIGNFSGTVSGEGLKYKVEGEVFSEALEASNVRLKAVKVNATVDGDSAMYNANGKAVAEMLTFEDFKIDYPQLIGNVRGTGTDFRWVGELQAVAAKSPLGTLGGLFITDASAEYKYRKFGATLGNVRARSFYSPEADVESLQARNVKINSDGDVTDVSAPNAHAGSVKTDSATLTGVDADNLRVKNRGGATDLSVDRARAETLETEDARLRNVAARDVRIQNRDSATDITAGTVRADKAETRAADLGELTAEGVDVKTTGNETLVYSNNLKVARIATDAAVLGSINVAGVRLTIRQGRVEATSNDFEAGDVTITEQTIAEGGKLENVRVSKPVFILEPSGAYRATADMSLGGGILGSVRLGAARASVVAENEQVALNDLTAEVMDGNLNGNALIALNDRRRSEVKADFDNLDLGKLLALSGGRVVPIEGKTTGQVDLNFAGTNFRTASGTVTADFNANAGTEERGLVPVNGKLGLRATDGLFDIDFANLFTDKSRLEATGSFDLNGYDSNLNLQLNSTDAGEIERIVRVLNLSPDLEQQLDNYEAEFAGNLKFSGNLTGSLDDPILNGRASLDSLILRKRNLGSLAADLYVSPTGLELRNGILQEPAGGGDLTFSVNVPNSGTNNISVRAELNEINTGNLLAALPVDAYLPEQFQDFQAQTSGTIDLSGLPNNMQGRADIVSGKGTVNGQPFDGFEARATFQGTLVNIEKFEGQFGDGTLKASGSYQTDSSAFNFDITGENVDLTRVRPFIPKSRDLPVFGGTLDITAKATGRADDPRTYDINFNGTGRNVVVKDRSVGEVAFVGKTENQMLSANLTLKFQGQPQEVRATVNFADENLPFRAETDFDQTELSPIIALIRPEQVDVSGQATGNVFLAGNLSALDENGKRIFTTDNLSGEANFSQFSLQIEETPLVATEPVFVRFDSKELFIDNAKFSGGGSNIVVNGTKAFTDNGINNLTVDGKINLRVFNAVSKNSFFAGLADVAVRLTGVNKTARLTGRADLQNASVATFIGAERLSFNRINGLIIFTSNQAQIDNLSGFLGGGRITASGGALVEGLRLQQFRLNVRGTNVTAPLPPDFITTGDAEGEISGFRDESGVMNSLIRGTFYAKRSVYTKDIDVADIISGRNEGSLTAGSSGSSSSAFIGVPKLDLRIEGRDALVVRNNLADLTASASLRVTGDIEFPQVSGRITANSGTIFFRKDRYEVQRGVLEFPPNTSFEPYITLQAESEIKGYQIIVGLVGSLTNTDELNATVRSNPALPQADVVSLITTGNLANTGAGIPTLAQSGINTAAEILTDSFINNPASRATDKLFGLNRFEIDPIISGERLNPSARLTVGRQINNNLLVTYSTNLSEDQNQVVAFEYRVSNRLSFVAQYEQRSLSNVTQRNNNFSFEIRLRKRF